MELQVKPLLKSSGKGAYVLDEMLEWDPEARKDASALTDRLQRLGLGPLLRNQEAKRIAKAIYEMRIAARRQQYRILFTIRDGIAWLLRAFRKKDEKTPQHEIGLAKQRANYIP